MPTLSRPRQIGITMLSIGPLNRTENLEPISTRDRFVEQFHHIMIKFTVDGGTACLGLPPFAVYGKRFVSLLQLLDGLVEWHLCRGSIR